MTVLVVGSLGLDTLKTPFGKVEDVLGGTVSYFSLAASVYTGVQVVAVVGTDFPEAYRGVLERRDVDLRGLQVKEGRTFRWSGQYKFDMNVAETLDTQLNVFADFHPHLIDDYRSTAYVFLANIHPTLQLEVLSQVHHPKLVVMDSMNLWISTSKETLTEVMRHSDIVLLNDGEVRQYSETPNLITAGRAILELGPRAVVIKKGEHGALLISREDGVFVAPAYPQDEVRDPTGAGDSFAGGFIGYLASRDDTSPDAIRRAIVHGSAVASFTVEEFGVGSASSPSSSTSQQPSTKC
ncbi:MAG: adenosine kinase [Chloroflexi bacterium]|nr:adenosine kinase [Chloroflexota bacterium]